MVTGFFSSNSNSHYTIGKMYESPHDNNPEITNSCIKKPYPTENDPFCAEFKEHNGQNYPKAGESIVIIHNKGFSPQQIICYGPSKHNLGWCGTCSFEQQKGINLYFLYHPN